MLAIKQQKEPMPKKLIQGFSLVELLIVVAIVAIIVGLTMTNLSFFDRILLRAELNKLHATCVYAQRCAMAVNKKQVITFDKRNKAYTFNGHRQKLARVVDFGVIVGAKGPPSSPNQAIGSPITFKDEQIVFEPNGVIGAGTVYLVDAKKRSMCALSCGISQVSFLRKYRYDNKWGLI